MPFLKIKKSLFINFGLALFFFCSPGFARTVVDMTGAKMEVVDSPQRVIPLTPALGELAADILGSDLKRIVAVTEYTNYPPGLKNLPLVGPYVRFSLEKVISFKPDLVLATSDGNSKEQIIHLRDLGIPVVTIGTESLAQISESMRLVALALGKPQIGVEMAERLERGLNRIRERGLGRTKKMKVLLQLAENPLIVVGRKSFVHEALLLLGATNVYGDATAHYPRPSLEDVMSKNPDVIVVIALGDDTAIFQKMADHWSSFERMTAMKNHQIHILRSDELIRPTERLLEGISRLEKTIYGKV